MALFDKDGRLVWLGIAIGAGGVALLPFVGPVIAAIARPFGKAVLTQGLLALERSREGAAHVAEGLEDILAEVRAEAQQRLAARKAAAHQDAGDVLAGVQAAAAGGGSKGVN